MNIVDIPKWQKRAQGLRKILKQKSLILMYHRVAKKGIDPWSLAVQPEHFEQHIKILKKYAQPISLSELFQAQLEGKTPHRAVAITFDDGYANNLYEAKPILEKYDFPATVFVTTGNTQTQKEFWWDELENLLFQIKSLPESLTLNIGGEVFSWNLGAATSYSEEELIQDYDARPWTAEPESRMYLYSKVWEVLQPKTKKEQQEALKQIADWAGYQPILRPAFRPMTPQELLELEKGQLINVGAHTVNHPFLSAQPSQVQNTEIIQSKNYLEKILNHPITTFAYPFGNYNQETLGLIKKAGFNCACTIEEETVWKANDNLELPRFNVIDWDGKTFKKKLLNWFAFH